MIPFTTSHLTSGTCKATFTGPFDMLGPREVRKTSKKALSKMVKSARKEDQRVKWRDQNLS